MDEATESPTGKTHDNNADIVIPTSSFRSALPVTTFSGKTATEEVIESLFNRAKVASSSKDCKNS